ncbi:hypothetical protein CM15mP37_09380 [bacterium]|nr:MAG: hypothetical protein CM15mP37_09380 [bacterium]
MKTWKKVMSFMKTSTTVQWFKIIGSGPIYGVIRLALSDPWNTSLSIL